ncbi:MAG: hypothetical protein J0I84_19940, partial [Terrimonas sp.]|nr:hypothetical protein [Terrimonas sp.]
MRYGKNILILALAIGLFLFFYIRYVNKERKQSIALLLNQPRTGDIYKIRYTDYNNNRTVRYFRVAEVTKDEVIFYRGKLSAWNVSDVFLNEFDLNRIETFSNDDLKLLGKGLYNS